MLEEAQAELSSVQNQLIQACSEIETIKAVATVSENTKQEAIDQVRSQWQEEVASLQAIMKGKHIYDLIKYLHQIQNQNRESRTTTVGQKLKHKQDKKDTNTGLSSVKYIL